MQKPIHLTGENLHPHLQARMHQRGVSLREIEDTINLGWDADDAKGGTLGRVLVFEFGMEWEGRFYQEKGVTVYYKLSDEGIVLLTVKARYGNGFGRR